MHRVFVYGTLKRSFFNHHILATQSAEFVRTATTIQAFSLFVDCCWIPYATKTKSTIRKTPASHTPTPLTGELFNIDEHTLERLDLLEGIHEQRYTREHIQLQDDQEPAYIYLLNNPPLHHSSHHHYITHYNLHEHQQLYVPPKERGSILSSSTTSTASSSSSSSSSSFPVQQSWGGFEFDHSNTFRTFKQ
jgi:gamma-glutamylcyclotransferase (GGCT)/AIG2-like uncharacterized protein YtfP